MPTCAPGISATATAEPPPTFESPRPEHAAPTPPRPPHGISGEQAQERPTARSPRSSPRPCWPLFASPLPLHQTAYAHLPTKYRTKVHLPALAGKLFHRLSRSAVSRHTGRSRVLSYTGLTLQTVAEGDCM